MAAARVAPALSARCRRDHGAERAREVGLAEDVAGAGICAFGR
jgi:hypothetical protein